MPVPYHMTVPPRLRTLQPRKKGRQQMLSAEPEDIIELILGGLQAKAPFMEDTEEFAKGSGTFFETSNEMPTVKDQLLTSAREQQGMVDELEWLQDPTAARQRHQQRNPSPDQWGRMPGAGGSRIGGGAYGTSSPRSSSRSGSSRRTNVSSMDDPRAPVTRQERDKLWKARLAGEVAYDKAVVEVQKVEQKLEKIRGNKSEGATRERELLTKELERKKSIAEGQFEAFRKAQAEVALVDDLSTPRSTQRGGKQPFLGEDPSMSITSTGRQRTPEEVAALEAIVEKDGWNALSMEEASYLQGRRSKAAGTWGAEPGYRAARYETSDAAADRYKQEQAEKEAAEAAEQERLRQEAEQGPTEQDAGKNLYAGKYDTDEYEKDEEKGFLDNFLANLSGPTREKIPSGMRRAREGEFDESKGDESKGDMLAELMQIFTQGRDPRRGENLAGKYGEKDNMLAELMQFFTQGSDQQERQDRAGGKLAKADSGDTDLDMDTIMSMLMELFQPKPSA